MLWIGIGALGIIGLIVLISAYGETKKGEEIIENPGVLIGTVVTALGVLLAAILPTLLRAEANSETVRAEVAVVKDHVQNSHLNADGTPLNLRDNIDANQGEMVSKFEALERLMRSGFEDLTHDVRHAIELTMGSAEDIRGVRKDIGRLTSGQNSHTRRINAIERKQDATLRALDTGSVSAHAGAREEGKTDE